MKAPAFASLLLLVACGRESQAPAPAPAAPAPALRFEQAEGGSGRAAILAHGQRLASVLGCKGCHGADMHGQPWEEHADLAISFSSNLTRALPAYSDAALERAIREGVRLDGSPLWDMPSEIFTNLDPADMAALIAYLRTLRPGGEVHPRIVFGPRGRREVQAGRYKPTPQLVRERRGQAPPRLDGRHEWARYMVRATCAECHGIPLEGATWPAGEPSPPDLDVVGAYTRDEFRRLLRTGEPTGGRRLGLMALAARGRFAHLTGREVDAIYDYLAARANRRR